MYVVLVLLSIIAACGYGNTCDDEKVRKSLTVEEIVPPILLIDDIVHYEASVGRMLVEHHPRYIRNELGLPDSIGVSPVYKRSIDACISIFAEHRITDDKVERSIVRIVRYTNTNDTVGAEIESRSEYYSGSRHAIVDEVFEIASDMLGLRQGVEIRSETEDEIQLVDEFGREIVLRAKSNMLSIVIDHTEQDTI